MSHRFVKELIWRRVFSGRVRMVTTNLKLNSQSAETGALHSAPSPELFYVLTITIDSLNIIWHDDKIRYLFFLVSPCLNYSHDT